MVLPTMRYRKTPRQEEAWRLRRTFGWSLKRIARRMNIKESAVCRLVDRARIEEGLPRRRRNGRAPRRRKVWAYPLANDGSV